MKLKREFAPLIHGLLQDDIARFAETLLNQPSLSRFDPSENFETIISSQAETWREWVKEKIDAEDFSNRALKVEKFGEKEINLSEMTKHIAIES